MKQKSIHKFPKIQNSSEKYHDSLKAQKYEKENKLTIPWVKQSELETLLKTK